MGWASSAGEWAELKRKRPCWASGLFPDPDVVGVNLTGTLLEGVTATDLVLRVTEMLRKATVVGKFVEFHGEGATSLSVTDRATIANMSPEYGATMGFFPVDEQTCTYLKATGRTDEQVDAVRSYYQAQGMFGIPKHGECEYSTLLDLDLGSIVPAVAGPKRPQDRIELSNLKNQFCELLLKPVAEGGYGKTNEEAVARYFTRIGTIGFAPTALKGGGEQRPESVQLRPAASTLHKTPAFGRKPRWSTTGQLPIDSSKSIRKSFLMRK